MSGVKRYGPTCDCMSEMSWGDYVKASDYDHIRTANQRLEAQRDAILLQARCWAGEAKTQQAITREVGEILGGVPDWGPIAEKVAAIVAGRQRLEGEVARLREALKFYADGDHLLLADPDAWDTCSGEPMNFQHDEAGTASVEDGSIAKAALRGNGGE